MAVTLFRNLQKILRDAALAIGLLVLSSFSMAQGLPDPTRPPAGFVDPADFKAGAAGGVVANSTGPDAPGLILQSVLLPQQGKPVAVISGKYLPLGARVDEWELRSVSEREVVLAQGNQRRVLKLTPQVTKTMTQTPATSGASNPIRAQKAKKSKAKESELKR